MDSEEGELHRKRRKGREKTLGTERDNKRIHLTASFTWLHISRLEENQENHHLSVKEKRERGTLVEMKRVDSTHEIPSQQPMERQKRWKGSTSLPLRGREKPDPHASVLSTPWCRAGERKERRDVRNLRGRFPRVRRETAERRGRKRAVSLFPSLSAKSTQLRFQNR